MNRIVMHIIQCTLIFSICTAAILIGGCSSGKEVLVLRSTQSEEEWLASLTDEEREHYALVGYYPYMNNEEIDLLDEMGLSPFDLTREERQEIRAMASRGVQPTDLIE